MFKRVLFTSILAAQFFAISAMPRTAVNRTDDPVPCPDCDAGAGPLSLASGVISRTDDPVPCPDCDAGAGPLSLVSALITRTDDPVPCPDCDAGAGPLQLA
jgi:hypothetical protein